MQPNAELTGVIAATLTPFVSNVGPVDDEWIPAHLRFLERQGVNGALALGTTGEGPSLSMAERKHVLDLVVHHRGSMFVVAGTGCASLVETIELSRYALDRGASAILVAPPFFFKAVPDAGVVSYYRALCDNLPANARLLLYHIPVVTGVPITSTIIEGLLESHRGLFYGIKDSSGDPQHTEALVQNYPQLHIYNGSDSQVANALVVGVAGVISAFSNVWPDRVRAVFDAHYNGGDVAAAQARLSMVRGIMNIPNVPALLKAALSLITDLPRTSVRAPLVNLSDDEMARLKEALQKI